MSRFFGREIDDVALWEKYIDIPQGAEKETMYWSKVVCPNPEHDTTKRHFQVNVADGLVHCFAYCGISGLYSHAICVIEGLYEQFKCDLSIKNPHPKSEEGQRRHRAFRQARKIILGYAGSGKRKSKVVRGQNRRADSDSFPVEKLEYDRLIPQLGIEYLDRRGITAESQARFGIGWCPETLRIVIPGRDLNGQTRFLIKRGVRESQQPKYLYTEGFPKTRLLFGACETSLELIRSQGIVLVEGSLDAIKLSQFGFQNIVATLGTGISPRQLEIVSRLRPRKIFCFFDKDSAGVTSLEIAERRFLGKYPIFVVRYPKTKTDPAECSREEVERALDRAIPLRSFKRRVKRLTVRS